MLSLIGEIKNHCELAFMTEANLKQLQKWSGLAFPVEILCCLIAIFIVSFANAREQSKLVSGRAM